MSMQDPISDMLTRLRNGGMSMQKEVSMPASKMKSAIAKVLLDEGYIAGYEEIEKELQNSLKVTLKYGEKGERVITGLKRISKPGLRVYAKSEELPKVLNGLGIAIVSTNKGIMTDKKARNQNLGGEVLAFVW